MSILIRAVGSLSCGSIQVVMQFTQKHLKIGIGIAIGLGVVLIIAVVTVPLVILLSKEEYCDKPATLPTSLLVSGTYDSVIIRWPQTGYTCNGSYLLQYSIDGEQQVKVSTTSREHIVVKPPLCSDMLIQLWTVGESGKISDESLDQNYTVLPINAYVTDTAINHTDNGIIASWGKPIGLENCEISYVVRFTSEFEKITEQTTSQSIRVPEDKFCFFLRVDVSTVVGFSESAFTSLGYADVKIAAELSIPSENPYTLLVTWNQRNQDVCSFSYEVTYRSTVETQVAVVSEPRVTFDVYYCVGALLIIRPTALGGEYTGYESVMAASQNPDTIVLEAVKNVKFERYGEALYVSWDVHKSLSHCWDLYNVTAENIALHLQTSCEAATGCVVTLTSFCPRTEIFISPIRYQGESVRTVYTCSD